MPFCVVPGDSGEHTICLSNQEENASQKGETEDEMDNTDLGDSAVS